MDQLRLLYVVFSVTLLLTISGSEVSGHGVNGTCLCQNSIFVVAHNSSNGVQLAVQDAAGSRPLTILVTSHYLPSECGTEFKRCNIHVFQYNSKLYVVFPVAQGLAAIVVHYEYAENESLLHFDPNYNFSVTEPNDDCTPTNVFLSRPQINNVLLTACLNLDAEHNSAIYYLEFTLDFDTGSLRQTDTSPREQLYDPATVSESIYVQEQQGCSEDNNLYVIDDRFLLQCPVVHELSIIGDFMYPQSQLSECSEYTSIENYGGNRILIRCSSELAVVFEPCIDEFEYFHASRRGIPYPCSSWENVAFLLNQTLLLLNSETQNEIEFYFPFEVSYGRCIEHKDSSIFIAGSANGTVAVLHTATGQLSILANDSGYTPSVTVSGAETVVSIPSMGQNTSKLIILNTTYEVGYIFAQILLEFHPDITAVLLSSEDFNCQCSQPELQPTTAIQTELPPTVTIPTTLQTQTNANTEADLESTDGQATTRPLTSTLTMHTESQTVSSTSSTTSRPTKLPTQGNLHLKLIPVYIVVIGGFVAVGICCFIWCKYPQFYKSCFKFFQRSGKEVIETAKEKEIEFTLQVDAYGDLSPTCSAVSDSESAMKKSDVAVAEQLVMPAEAYSVEAVGSQLGKRCDTEEKAVDFEKKCAKC